MDNELNPTNTISQEELVNKLLATVDRANYCINEALTTEASLISIDKQINNYTKIINSIATFISSIKEQKTINNTTINTSTPTNNGYNNTSNNRDNNSNSNNNSDTVTKPVRQFNSIKAKDTRKVSNNVPNNQQQYYTAQQYQQSEPSPQVAQNSYINEQDYMNMEHGYQQNNYISEQEYRNQYHNNLGSIPTQDNYANNRNKNTKTLLEESYNPYEDRLNLSNVAYNYMQQKGINVDTINNVINSANNFNNSNSIDNSNNTSNYPNNYNIDSSVMLTPEQIQYYNNLMAQNSKNNYPTRT